VKSIAIIGAGIAGLSAGCYAQMNGYQAQIYEMHVKPGGLCTAWQRRGYLFDGCIHHLGGSGPRSPLYQLWDELGVFDRHEMIFHDNLVRVELPDGQGLTLYTDIDRLEAYLKDLSPADGPVIDEYIRAARVFLPIDLLGIPFAGLWGMVKLLPKMPALSKWGKITLEQFAERFQHPLLRKAFPTLQYDFPGVPVLIHLNFLANCHNHTLGWPSGGALAFARGLATHLKELGGQIHYRAEVDRILVEAGADGGDRAVGVRLADGSEHEAGVVISAADGQRTIYHMLEGKYVDDRIQAYYDAAPDGNEMNFAVALGVDRDMTGEPHALTLFLEEPVEILGRPHDRLDVEVFNFDPALAPEGKTPLKVLLKATYSYWKALYADRERYDAEKQAIAETVIAQLDQRWPGLAGQVEAIDVSTPVTIERYTGNYHGLQAWGVPGAGMSQMLKGFTRTLPGLARFHMAGQWAEAMIGISTAAVSGRNAIRRVCREDGQRFVTGGEDGG
jgi:phytoene dehydrogenase-like protein